MPRDDPWPSERRRWKPNGPGWLWSSRDESITCFSFQLDPAKESQKGFICDGCTRYCAKSLALNAKALFSRLLGCLSESRDANDSDVPLNVPDSIGGDSEEKSANSPLDQGPAKQSRDQDSRARDEGSSPARDEVGRYSTGNEEVSLYTAVSQPYSLSASPTASASASQFMLSPSP